MATANSSGKRGSKRTDAKATNVGASGNRTARATADGGTTVMPQINVQCVNPRCEQYEVVVTVDAGAAVAPNVLAMYAKYSCGVCGFDLANVIVESEV